MSFLSRTPTSSPARAVFTIAPHAVSVAVVAEKKTPHVLWSKQRRLQMREGADRQHRRQAVRQALSHLQESLHKKKTLKDHTSGGRITSVDCVLSGPWHISDTVDTQQQSDQPFLLTSQRMQTAIEDGHRQFHNRRKNDSSYQKSRWSHLHHRIISAAENGSRITFPHKEPVEDLRLRMHISKVAQPLKKVITDILEKSFRPEAVKLHSLTDLASRWWAQRHRLSKDFAIAMVGPRQMNISHVKNGMLHQVVTHPTGEDLFVQAVSRALNRPVSDIRSQFALHQKDKHHRSSGRAIRIALDEVGRRLGDFFGQAVADTFGERGQKKHVYLTTTDRTEGGIFQKYAQKSARTHDLHLHPTNQQTFTNDLKEGGSLDHFQVLGILGTQKSSK